MPGLQGTHKPLISKLLFVLFYFAGVPLALLVPLLTGVICGLRMEKVGRRWGLAIGAAVGILAAALVLFRLESPLTLVRRISGPHSFGFGLEGFIIPVIISVLGAALVWSACFLRARVAKDYAGSG